MLQLPLQFLENRKQLVSLPLLITFWMAIGGFGCRCIDGTRCRSDGGSNLMQLKTREDITATLRGLIGRQRPDLQRMLSWRSQTGPREERQAQLDRGRVERVNGVAQVDVQRLARVQQPRPSDEQKRDIPVDAPVPRLVRVGEVVSRNAGLDAHVVQVPAVRRKARLDVAQAFAACELSERHRIEMAPTRKRLDPFVALVPLHDALELPLRKVVHHLTENRPPLMHSRPPPVSKEETVASELKRSRTFSHR